MESEFVHNPFEAPRFQEQPVSKIEMSESPSWLRWCSIAVVCTVFINAGLLAWGDRQLFGLPIGQSIAILCGVMLVAMAVAAGIRFRFRVAFGLLQVLNLITWVTMMITVYFVLPHTLQDELRVRDIPIFVWIWAVAAFVVFLIVAVGGYWRKTHNPLVSDEHVDSVSA